MPRKMYRGPASTMWNEETRKAMFWLLQQNGLPLYKYWGRIMRPGVEVLPTKEYEDIFRKTAAQMNELYPHYLMRAPDRRRWLDQQFTGTGVEAQAAFAIQQGKNYGGGNGYEHRKTGHLNTTIYCLRAALSTGFMTFEDISEHYHKYVVAASQTKEKVIPQEVIQEVEKMSSDYVTKKSKEIITEVAEPVEAAELSAGLSARELELVEYTISAVTALIEDNEWTVVDTANRCRISGDSIKTQTLDYVNEFAPDDLELGIMDEILELPLDDQPLGSPLAEEPAKEDQEDKARRIARVAAVVKELKARKNDPSYGWEVQ
jgi:hypothetical protein